MMRQPDSLDIVHLPGESVPVEFLGAGCYSAAFRGVDHPHRVFLFTETTENGRSDRSKEVLALAKSYNDSEHLPVMVDCGTQRYDGSTFRVFETTYSVSTSEGDWVVSPEVALLEYKSSLSEIAEANKHALPYEGKLSPSILGALRDIERACESFGLSSVGRGRGKRFDWDLHGGNFGLDPSTKTLILRDPITAIF